MACASRQNKTWTDAKVFWNEKVNLKRTCAVTAGQYIFGGNATDTATTEERTTTVTMEASYHHRTIHRPQKHKKLSTMIITVGHTEAKLPKIIQVRHATNSIHQA